MMKFSLLLLPTLISAGDNCSPISPNCICFDDPKYYTREECYSTDAPWGQTSMRPFHASPDSPAEQKITFELYTPENRIKFEEISLADFESNIGSKYRVVLGRCAFA